jgi:hypothetical protein
MALLAQLTVVAGQEVNVSDAEHVACLASLDGANCAQSPAFRGRFPLAAIEPKLTVREVDDIYGDIALREQLDGAATAQRFVVRVRRNYHDRSSSHGTSGKNGRSIEQRSAMDVGPIRRADGDICTARA